MSAPAPPPSDLPLRARATGLVPLVAGLVLATACAGPVGVTRVGPDAVHRTLSQNALSAREPSSFSMQVLQRFNLRERFQSDPAGALATLHQTLGSSGRENRLFALAELSFLHAERTRGPGPLPCRGRPEPLLHVEW